MKIKRRDFLKGIAGGAALCATSAPLSASAAKKERSDKAVE